MAVKKKRRGKSLIGLPPGLAVPGKPG